MQDEIARRDSVHADRESRVEARMVGGCICCPAGHPNFTFRAGYLVKDALADSHWVKLALKEDVAEDEIISGYTDTKMAIVMLNRQPTCIVFANQKPAQPEDPIGLHGGVVTVLFTQVAAEVYEDVPCMDADGIETPPTPSPR